MSGNRKYENPRRFQRPVSPDRPPAEQTSVPPRASGRLSYLDAYAAPHPSLSEEDRIDRAVRQQQEREHNDYQRAREAQYLERERAEEELMEIEYRENRQRIEQQNALMRANESRTTIVSDDDLIDRAARQRQAEALEQRMRTQEAWDLGQRQIREEEAAIAAENRRQRALGALVQAANTGRAAEARRTPRVLRTPIAQRQRRASFLDPLEHLATSEDQPHHQDPRRHDPRSKRGPKKR